MNRDFGLLFLRVTFGLLLAGHGLGKAQDLIAGKTTFADPLGIGPVPSLMLAVFAELVCALAVVVGLKTRWTAIPPVVTMLVAAFMVHAADDWKTKEFPVLYACGFLTLVFTGAGKYALDEKLKKR